MTERGSLIVLSGPSGTGKDTVLKPLLEELDTLRYSVSATTRSPRAGEVDGKHYHFVGKERFFELLEAGEMLEYAQYGENYYGTRESSVERQLEAGYDVLLIIEVQGAVQVKAKKPDAVMIFLAPPSLKALESRLRGRATEQGAAICTRLETAKTELECATEYEYLVINDDVMRAKDEIAVIIKAARFRTQLRRGLLADIKE